jgi:hypothetical protein
MQGPYTVCKERPTKVASKAARTTTPIWWGAKCGLGRAVRDGPIETYKRVGKYPSCCHDPQKGNQSVELRRPPVLKGLAPSVR